MVQQIMLVDDDPVQRRLLEAQVSRMGYRAILCENGGDALKALKAAREDGLPAAMVLDLMMPGLSGLEVMSEMRRARFDVPVIVQTAQGGVDTAVAAMRAGALDFVVKPASPAKLAAAIDLALRLSKARRRRANRAGAREPEAAFEPASEAMQAVRRQAERAAASTIPVLIQGETGSGKEWLADFIRAQGRRAAKPFAVVNCGALPASLAESLLFGHARGSFTGAADARAGRFLDADGGTLLLDEVGELPLEVQAKLLRVLQNGEIDPVGGAGTVTVDVRVLAATNRSLEREVAAGRFREDLFFRLNVLTIEMPPLRRRRADIRALATRFLREACRIEGLEPDLRFDPEVLALFEAYDWPGNVRQLENAVHRAVVLREADELTVLDFPQIGPAAADRPALAEPAADPVAPARAAPRAADPPSAPDSTPFLDADGNVRTIDAVEGDLLRLALLRHGGRLSEVARRLGIGRSTLYRKLKAHGIKHGEAA